MLNFLSLNNQKLTSDDIEALSSQAKCTFNSYEAYAHCFTNISVMLMLLNEYDLAHKCCIKSIELQPNDKEAYINMNNIMRQIGRKKEAFQYVW